LKLLSLGAISHHVQALHLMSHACTLISRYKLVYTSEYAQNSFMVRE